MLQDKSILITGCSSGIGLRAAQLLKQRGYKVYASARKAEDVAKLQEQGFIALQLDVTSHQQMDQAIEFICKDNNGRLGALFNNAGYSQVGAVEDLSDEALKAQFETNFFGLVELTKKVLPLMRQAGEGRIIQNSSVFGLASSSFRGAYSASKYALEAWSDALRLELKRSCPNIFVTLVEPGPIVSRVRQNKKIYFEKYIKPGIEQSHYKDTYLKMDQALAMTGRIPFTLEPDSVVESMMHALESRNPKPRYYVTQLTWIYAIAKRILSHRGFDRLASWVGRKEAG
ncbi:SDR family NAD(P)-dependent oxidoreductase [Pelagibaculum spongiae]|uniref:Short-chain dehydrogenase n=1 Tax=Pelagibaculum spongiae TaxID=2080658 RepID=A0A2V1H0F1_9GAMM|nr:SDR family NAD(P)-dependent oxidoreductase [Pelagibaculum spongiae]PVZ69472.1 short-chain dehydrogenase [Pelagibaculum spongiae]